MDIISKIYSTIKIYINKQVKLEGPNTLQEIINQFDLPVKQKTKADILKDYQIKETIAAIEVEYLRDCPVTAFKGAQRWYDKNGNLYFDWVPCTVRPEVVYCSYGKN